MKRSVLCLLGLLLIAGIAEAGCCGNGGRGLFKGRLFGRFRSSQEPVASVTIRSVTRINGVQVQPAQSSGCANGQCNVPQSKK